MNTNFLTRSFDNKVVKIVDDKDIRHFDVYKCLFEMTHEIL